MVGATHTKDGTLHRGKKGDVSYVWEERGWTIEAMRLAGILHAGFVALAVLSAGVGITAWRTWLGRQYNKMELPKYRD